jgi:hypothetical protein
MALYKDVELIDGRTVRVHRPPYARIHANVRRRLPEPQIPVATDKNVTGREISMPVPDDPTYLAKHAAWEIRYEEEVEMMGSLFVFKDEEVPDDWDVEAVAGAEMRYFDPEWTPREGPMGRKLDYIQWDILDDSLNALRVTNAIRELSGIDLEEVRANTASFRDEVEGEAD